MAIITLAEKLHGVVYLTSNLINGKLYIGQTTKTRKGYLGSGIGLRNDIRKYGKNNFSREILENCSSKDELNEAEKYWIEYFGYPFNENLYNLMAGGTGDQKRNITDETRRKMSESQKGKKLSAETKRRVSESLKGRPVSQETKDKISLAQKGKPRKKHSKETRMKMSQIHKGRKHPKRSEETLKRMSEVQKGKKLSVEHRKKMSDSHKQRWEKIRESQEGGRGHNHTCGN